MDTIARKLEPASTKATNLRKEEVRKKQKVVDRRKTVTMAEKPQRDRGENSLSIENDRYYDSNTYGTDLNQEDNFNYPVKD